MEVFVFNWNNIMVTIAWIWLKKTFFMFLLVYICYILYELLHYQINKTLFKN